MFRGPLNNPQDRWSLAVLKPFRKKYRRRRCVFVFRNKDTYCFVIFPRPKKDRKVYVLCLDLWTFRRQRTYKLTTFMAVQVYPAKYSLPVCYQLLFDLEKYYLHNGIKSMVKPETCIFVVLIKLCA